MNWSQIFQSCQDKKILYLIRAEEQTIEEYPRINNVCLIFEDTTDNRWVFCDDVYITQQYFAYVENSSSCDIWDETAEWPKLAYKLITKKCELCGQRFFNRVECLNCN